MIRFPFTNAQAAFFYLAEGDIDDDGEPIPDGWMFSNHVVVEHVEWPEMVEFSCQYCGSAVNPGEKCPGCQNAAPIREGSIGKARAFLRAVMPHGLFIFNPPSKFAINYLDCGRLDYFENYDMRVTFDVLRVCRRILDDPMCFDPSDQGVVHLLVEVEADVAISFPEGAPTYGVCKFTTENGLQWVSQGEP